MLNYYHLIVVGKGVSRPYLKLALSLGIKERVHFLGPQPDGSRYTTLCKALILFLNAIRLAALQQRVMPWALLCWSVTQPDTPTWCFMALMA